MFKRALSYVAEGHLNLERDVPFSKFRNVVGALILRFGPTAEIPATEQLAEGSRYPFRPYNTRNCRFARRGTMNWQPSADRAGDQTMTYPALARPWSRGPARQARVEGFFPEPGPVIWPRAPRRWALPFLAEFTEIKTRVRTLGLLGPRGGIQDNYRV